MVTSRPYALCHQLSKGADVIMANPPQAAMKAPSGPRKPHIFTLAALRCNAAGLRPNVVESIKKPEVRPPSTPQSWIAKWAGVQNVSRPMVWCQATSQYAPIMSEVMATSMHQIAAGMRKVAEVPFASGMLMETGWLVSGTATSPFCAATALVVSSAFMECPQMRVDHDSWTNSESLGNAENLLKKF